MASDELEFVRELLGSMSLATMTLAEQRAAIEASAGSPPEGMSVVPVDAGGVAGEWIVAAGVSPRRTLVSLHGGAYSVGSLATNRRFSALLSAAAEARVLSLGYRLAPEHPFPAAVDDAVAAYRWLLLHERIDPRSIGVCGNSAGGGLALAALLALRDHGDPLPGGAVALCPWTDLEGTGESVISCADTEVMLDPAGLHTSAALYARPHELRHPYASPIHGMLHGLPPLLIQVSTSEILRDDSTRFAALAAAAEVDVTLEVWDDMPHVWHMFAGLLPEADRALAAIGRWCHEHLPSAPDP